MNQKHFVGSIQIFAWYYIFCSEKHNRKYVLCVMSVLVQCFVNKMLGARSFVWSHIDKIDMPARFRSITNTQTHWHNFCRLHSSPVCEINHFFFGFLSLIMMVKANSFCWQFYDTLEAIKQARKKLPPWK